MSEPNTSPENSDRQYHGEPRRAGDHSAWLRISAWYDKYRLAIGVAAIAGVIYTAGKLDLYGRFSNTEHAVVVLQTLRVEDAQTMKFLAIARCLELSDRDRATISAVVPGINCGSVPSAEANIQARIGPRLQNP